MLFKQVDFQANTLNHEFVGQQLGPNEVITKCELMNDILQEYPADRTDVVHDKNTARLLFRPRSVRPQVDILYPEEKSVSFECLDVTNMSA